MAILSTRIGCAFIGGGLATLLVAAAMLTPDTRGYGTHEQLGLPPCTFATLTGKPCPLCGMTTAWSHLTHGHVATAAKTHATGTLLGMAAMVLSGWTLAYAIVGEKRIKLPAERVLIVAGIGLMLLVFVEWIVRLASQGFGAAL